MTANPTFFLTIPQYVIISSLVYFQIQEVTYDFR